MEYCLLRYAIMKRNWIKVHLIGSWLLALCLCIAVLTVWPAAAAAHQPAVTPDMPSSPAAHLPAASRWLCPDYAAPSGNTLGSRTARGPALHPDFGRKAKSAHIPGQAKSLSETKLGSLPARIENGSYRPGHPHGYDSYRHPSGIPSDLYTTFLPGGSDHRPVHRTLPSFMGKQPVYPDTDGRCPNERTISSGYAPVSANVYNVLASRCRMRFQLCLNIPR